MSSLRGTEIDRTELDGAPASAETLDRVTAAYGHFTAMQVRGGGARGLDLHLRRLAETNRERFDADLDPERIRTLIRGALDGMQDASVRVYLYEASPQPRVVVTVKPPGDLVSPQRLRSVPYRRPDAHLKHLRTEQGRYREEVQRAGYDDALLTGDDGVVSETSVANIGFFDGDAVVWPDAPLLRGVTMQLLEEGLPRRGVAVRRERVLAGDIERFDGAFLSNARGIATVSAVDDVELPQAREWMLLLHDVYGSVRWDPI